MKKGTKINVIEVDEKTSEPKIVEVDIDDPCLEEKVELKEEHDFVEQKSKSSLGKQLFMDSLGGYKPIDSTAKRKKVFTAVFYILFVIFVVGVLAYTFYNDFFADNGKDVATWEQLATVFSVSWPYIFPALFCVFLCFFLKALKLSIMCKSQTGKWHFKTCFETGIIGHYYNDITPLAVGGQPFEIYHLSKHGVKGGVAASLPIAAYFSQQIAFVLLSLSALILLKYNVFQIPENLFTTFGGYTTTVNIVAIVGLVLSAIAPTLVILFSVLPKLSSKLVVFVFWLGSKLKIVKNPKLASYKTFKTVLHNSKCLKSIASKPLVFMSTFLISFGELLAMCSISYFVLRFFGYDLPEVNGVQEWCQIIQLTLILYMSISFIPTPGNSGAADLSFYLLFSTGLTTAGLAFPAMAVWRFLSFYLFIIIGFIFATTKKRIDKKQQKLLLNNETNEN